MGNLVAVAALANSIGAGMVVLFTLLGGGRLEGNAFWIVIKLLASAFVIVQGALTILFTRDGSRWTHQSQVLLLLGGAILVGIGSASAVWGLHLVETTGDFEGYVFLLSASMVIQGVLTVWHIFSSASKLKPAR